MKIISGIQPTGHLHLGNYLGAIKSWKELQNQYECKFGIMDLHSMTTGDIAWVDYTKEVLIRCGIKKENIYIQSQQKGLLEFFWKLSCNVSIGDLNRMTQFKEKSNKNNENLGLYSYPVLMAADILFNKADLVPVGADQQQHLELARKLARRLELNEPEPLISKSCGRIQSLIDPFKKMSKSDANDNSRINLDDSIDKIFFKLKKANSDEMAQCNLIDIYQGCGGKEDIKEIFKNNSVQAKELIAKQIIEEIK